jgi:hypothetical protein
LILGKMTFNFTYTPTLSSHGILLEIDRFYNEF